MKPVFPGVRKFRDENLTIKTWWARFFKNLASALGHCIFEDAEVMGIVVPALVCVGILWLIGKGAHDCVFDFRISRR